MDRWRRPHANVGEPGSELIAQGQRIEIVQRVLGHRDIRSTLGYAELQEAQVRAALERPTPALIGLCRHTAENRK
jgi:hypothetical protein